MKLPRIRRRAVLLGAAAVTGHALAQASRRPGAIAVAQVVDTSAGEQDVTKDFLIGARAAWQDINARGGLRGRPVQHLELQCDGSAAGVQEAWRAARDNPECVALAGTAGSGVAARLAALLREDGAAIAHAAPWLQDSSGYIDERTFPIFSGRREQIAHALKSLSISGMQEVGAIYASPAAAARHREDVTRAAAMLRLRVAAWTGNGNLAQLGQRLAGFISARYAFQVLAGIDGAITRASVLAAFQRWYDMDVGGYRVRFQAGRSAAFVTQSMLTPDGRVVG